MLDINVLIYEHTDIFKFIGVNDMCTYRTISFLLLAVIQLLTAFIRL